MSHATARPRQAGTSFESQATSAAGSGYESQAQPGPLNVTSPAHCHPGQARNAYSQLGGYRVPPTRRAVTVGNEAPPAGLASKVPGGSDPSTLAWPSRCPAALRRRHRYPAAQRSWSRSFAPGDTFQPFSDAPVQRKRDPVGKIIPIGARDTLRSTGPTWRASRGVLAGKLERIWNRRNGVPCRGSG